MHRRTRGLIAGIILLAATIGLPIAVAATIGNPIHNWTSIHATQASDSAVMAILASVFYLAWASFVIPVLVEVATTITAWVTHRPRREFRLPLLGAQQELARTLVSAVLLILPAATATTSTAHAPITPHVPLAATATLSGFERSLAAHDAAAHRSDTGTRPAVAERTYVIPAEGGMRSYWALAEHYLGDGARWHEIWSLNRGRTHTDGTVMDTPRRLYAGWSVRIPAAGNTSSTETAPMTHTHHVTVHPDDTLSGLAAADGVPDWESVWPANQIRPGWTVVLPDDGTHPPRHTSAAKPPPRRQSPDSRNDGSAPYPLSAVSGGPGADTPPTTAAVPPSVAAHTPKSQDAPPASSGSSADAARPAHRQPSHQPDLTMMAFAGGGGALLAGLSLAALVGYRRRQFRARRPGRTISRTPAELVGTERALLAAGYAAAADVSWLDQALRGLVQQVAARDDVQLPDVMAVSMTDDILTLVLSHPARDAPPPWQVDSDGTRWSAHRGDPLGYDEDNRAFFFSPYPTLVSVGYTKQGEQWLLDLERISALSLSGDPERCLDLVRFLAAELAHNTWSEMLAVTLVGFGAELVAANPDRLTCTDDLDGAVAALHSQLDSVNDGMRVAQVDVLTGRLRDVAADRWAPHVLLIAPQTAADTTGLERLHAVMKQRESRASVALVIANEVVAGSELEPSDADCWHLIVDCDGTLRIPALDLTLIAQQLPADEASQLAEMLALAAVVEDQPVPASRGEARWEAYADSHGGLTLTAPGSKEHPAESPAPADDSLLPLAPVEYLEQTATTEPDLHALAPPVDETIRVQVEDADPDLDADLADWFDPHCPRPRLTLLGPVEVRAQGSLPERNPRRAFHTEIVAYLATRIGGVPSDRYAMTMWPDELDIVGKTKVRQSVSTVRAWLGRDPCTGVEYLPSGLHDTGAARYRINDILIDAELFRRLRLRGTARGADGIGDLHRALDLVTGKPFDELPFTRAGSPGGYGWLADANSRLDHEYSAMIVDVAHIIATHHLAAGEPELAERAAQVALRSGTYEDVPLLDLVAACDAQDHRAEADAYVKRILSNHDADVEEDLPPRTAEVLFRRQWINRAS
jgi:hypothetical protein